MGNKNKYNNYFNGGNNTPEHFSEEKDNIVESSDISTVDTTSVSDNIIENQEIISDQNNVGLTSLEEITNISEEDNHIEETNVSEEDNHIEENIESSQNNDSTTNIQNVRVNAKALNIRKEPKKDADIITIVYEDELLILCESTSIDGFYKVRTYTGFEGYCMEQFVNLV